MSQDTRKDPRAKIVSLNVRYKSATVDEFIENHSHDVSRGGLFIKTSTPFAQGTLLKFEIRLSSDQAVIAGVGRVVWKREPSQAATDRPAGMGVKFIKIDDRSRALIERLVTTKQDAGSAFNTLDDEVTKVVPGGAAQPPDAAAAGRAMELPSLKPTVSGMPAVSASGSLVEPAELKAPPVARNFGSSPGFGSSSSAGSGSGSGSGNFFPTTNSEADMPPPQERTLMRQAAELLEEALKASGGSMDEVEQNPLFAGLQKGGNPNLPPEPANNREEVATIGGFPTSSPAASALETPVMPLMTSANASRNAEAREANVAATNDLTPMVETPAHRSLASTERRSGSVPPPRVSMSSDPPARSSMSARPVRATDLMAESAPKKGGGGMIALVAVVLLGAGGAYAYQAGMLDEVLGQKPAPSPKPTATQAAPPVTAATSAIVLPTPVPTPSTSMSAASASASAAASVAASATPPAGSGSAKPTPSASAAMPVPVEPVAVKPPTPAPVKPKPKPVEPTPVETTEKPVDHTEKPVEPKPVEATASDEPKPTPKPKPKPKPKDDSDNPY